MANADTLYTEVIALPPTEQRRLLSMLQEYGILHASTDYRPDIRGRYNALRDTVADIAGLDGIENRCKSRTYASARFIVMYQLRREGYSLSEIARVMQRHHASVIHGLEIVENMFLVPNAYPYERGIWAELQKRLAA